MQSDLIRCDHIDVAVVVDEQTHLSDSVKHVFQRIFPLTRTQRPYAILPPNTPLKIVIYTLDQTLMREQENEPFGIKVFRQVARCVRRVIRAML